MSSLAAAGAGFLAAVLWFDLMFDVQVRGQGGAEPAPGALASVCAYYRRVTTDAAPMSGLISAVMALTIGALVAEIATGRAPSWTGWLSLCAAASAIGLAGARTVRNAKALGQARAPGAGELASARSVLRDHIYCFAAMSVVVAVQVLSLIHI